jgi:D-glycero-alpha-D-manno-heptose-7-phosphate kinase
MLISRTPVRIELGGGGTDVEPYASDYKGYVLNTAINMHFRCVLSKREDNNLINIYSNDTFSNFKFNRIKICNDNWQPSNLFEAVLFLLKPKSGLDIYIHGEPPKKAGLGASASLCTCLISGISKLENKSVDLNEIAEKAYQIEQDILKNLGGRQDQYSAVYGGFNGITFLGNSSVQIDKIDLSKSFEHEIEKNIILFYTGEPHTSGDMVKYQIESYLKEKETSKYYLDKLKETAYLMKDALLSENFENFGSLLTKDLEIKSKFNPFLTTDYMKRLHEIVISNGGIGGRVCGAGGGGCMIWLIDPSKLDNIKDILRKQKGKLLDFKFVKKGLELLNI